VDQRCFSITLAPRDLAELRQAIQPIGVDLARHIVVMARGEAMDFLGETRQSLAMVRARLWPEQP
jgi:hypothetical protein